MTLVEHLFSGKPHGIPYVHNQMNEFEYTINIHITTVSALDFSSFSIIQKQAVFFRLANSPYIGEKRLRCVQFGECRVPQNCSMSVHLSSRKDIKLV